MIANRSKFIKDVGFALGSQFLARAVPAVLLILVARTFGQDAFVNLSLFNYSATALAALVSLGMPNLAIKLAAQATTDPQRLKELVASFAFTVVLAVLASVALQNVGIADWFGSERVAIGLVFLAAVSMAFFTWSTNVLSGLHLQTSTFWAALVSAIVLLVVFGLAWFFGNPYLLYWGLCASFALPTMLQFRVISSRLKLSLKNWLPSPDSLRQAIEEAFWYSLMAVIGPMIPLLFSRFLLQTDPSGHSVALFSIGFQLMSIFSLIPSRIVIVLFPYQIRQDDSDSTVRKLRLIVLAVIVSSGIFALLCALGATPLLAIWHVSSTHATVMMFGFIMYGGLAVSNALYGNQLIAVGKIRQVVGIALFGHSMAVATGWILARWGGEFVSVALVFGQTFILIATMLALQPHDLLNRGQAVKL
ncbi:MAG: oligosaccharide flippase family protein [Aestuariivirga sp.]